MHNKITLQRVSVLDIMTDRLHIRPFTSDDTDFVLKSCNEPAFIESIGDKNIRNEQDALAYLEDGPIKSYLDNGFGLMLITLKSSKQAIGCCGLIKRDNVPDIDLGYSLLKDFHGVGYASEATTAVLAHAKQTLKLRKVVAYTSFTNQPSIIVLEKLGFVCNGVFDLPGYDSSSKYFELKLYP